MKCFTETIKSSCACNYEDGKIMNGQMDCTREFIIVLICLTIGRMLKFIILLKEKRIGWMELASITSPRIQESKSKQLTFLEKLKL